MMPDEYCTHTASACLACRAVPCRPLQILKIPGQKTLVSSVFFMCLPDRVRSTGHVPRAMCHAYEHVRYASEGLLCAHGDRERRSERTPERGGS